MDVLEEFLAGTKAAPPQPRAAAPKTDKQAQGVADLDSMIGRMQADLQDIKPGSAMHARLTRDLAEAQKERSRYGQTAQPAQVAAPVSGDPLEAFLSGAPKSTPALTPAATPAPAIPREQLIAQIPGQRGPVPQPAAPAPTAAPTLGDRIAGVGEAGVSLLAGGLAAPVSALGGIYGTLTSGKFGTPEGIQAGQQKAAEIQRAMTQFQPRTQTGQQILQSMAEATEAAKLPPVMPEALALQAPAAAAAQQAVGKVRAGLAPGIRTAQPQAMTPQAVAQMQAQFAARQPGAKAGSIGAAMVEGNPFAGQLTGEEGARGMFPQVKLSKTTQDVPAAEQSTRASIINEVLGTGQVRPGVVTGNENTLRTEYTMAKHPERGPANELLKRQIAEEQVALSNYAEQRVANTGASPTLMTPFERGERINNFFAGVPAEGEGPSSVVSFFRQEKQRVYDQARQQVGNNPITTGHVNALLSDPQFKAGLKLQGAEGVASGAAELIDLARTTGFKDTAGNFYPPNTIGAWDAVRKSLNADWTPANAKVIRKINRAIDQDIASAGGGNLLKMADSIHEAEKTIFGSKGIKNLFGEIDSNGVETGRVSFDALPQRLNSMPFNEWRHIYDTADKLSRGELFGPRDPKTGAPKWSLPVPPEVQAAAQNAKAEMLGNLAREVQQAGAAKAGVWSQNAANKVLNARADKIKYAFPLEEQQAFHKLNYAGQLMPGEHGYEGAALQQRRVGLIESQIPRAATGVGAAAGGLVAGPTGAAVGGYVMGKAGGRAAEKLAERAARKEAERLQEEMKKTSKLSELGK